MGKLFLRVFVNTIFFLVGQASSLSFGHNQISKAKSMNILHWGVGGLSHSHTKLCTTSNTNIKILDSQVGFRRFSCLHANVGQDGDEKYSVSSENRVVSSNELDEVAPPSISFTRNSVLFDPDAPTQKENEALNLWRQTKSFLPPLVTGAWEEGKGDRKPLEHFYNMVFVRIPVVLMGGVYLWNYCIGGHGLNMSFGSGNLFEVPPLIVVGVIYIMLR